MTPFRISFAFVLAIIWSVSLGVAQTAKEPAARRVAPSPFPFDLSFLNHRPAGVRGRVSAKEGALEFGDGTPAKFWGVNIQAGALFSTQDDLIVSHAKHLARSGVNLVRLHHHDSPWVNPNIFGIRGQRTAQIDPQAMRKIDKWVAALRAEGIYIWLDLHVGRLVTPQDNGSYLSELYEGKHGGDLRGYNYVNPAIKQLMQEFAAQYLTHVNPYTGYSYATDPAVVAVLISNENDLVSHFAQRLLPGKGTDQHARLYIRLAEQFAARHDLNPDDVWQGWQAGPAKLFLADLEYRFHREMISHLRSLGYGGLIATSNFWGGMEMSGLASLSQGDIVDVHSYGKDKDIFKSPQSATNMLANIAVAQVVNRPLSVSEWNIGPAKSDDRLTAPFRMASTASYQGWDTLLLYGYAQKPLQDKPSFGRWHGVTDPNLNAAMPAAALLYRLGQVPPAESRYIFSPSVEELFGGGLKANKLPELRSLLDKAKVEIALPATPVLPWLKPVLPQEDARPSQGSKDQPAALLPRKTLLKSKSSPFQHRANLGQFVIDTPQAQVVAGAINPQSVALSNLQIITAAPDGVIALQSLSMTPIAETDRILLTVSRPAGSEENGTRNGEIMAASVTFEASADLHDIRFSENGGKGRVSHEIIGKRHKVTFTEIPSPLWILLSK